MSPSPDKWDTFWKNVQLVVGTLLAITAAAYVETLGLLGLGLIWLGLYAVVSTVYAVRFRSELREARKAMTRPTKTGGMGSLEIQRLESDLAKTQEIAEQLMVEKGELRGQTRSVESHRERVKALAAEKAELKIQVRSLERQRRSREELKDDLLKQLRRIPSLRRYTAPLENKERRKFMLWRQRTIKFLERAFGEDSDSVREFSRIRYESSAFFTVPQSDYVRGLDRGEVFLQVLLEQFE